MVAGCKNQRHLHVWQIPWKLPDTFFGQTRRMIVSICKPLCHKVGMQTTRMGSHRLSENSQKSCPVTQVHTNTHMYEYIFWQNEKLPRTAFDVVCCVLICCPSLIFVCCLFAALRTRNKVQKLQSGCCRHAKWARRRGERGGWLSKASR